MTRGLDRPIRRPGRPVLPARARRILRFLLPALLVPLSALHGPSPARGARPFRLDVNFRDAETGAPTPVRAGLFDGLGDPLVLPDPAARMVQSLSADSYFYCAGTLSLDLPPGDLVIEAGKGFDYLPVRLDLHLTTDTLITVDMVRWVDLTARNLVSGDTHVHLTHPPVLYDLAPSDARLWMEAENLQFLNVMDRDSFFTGAAHPLSGPDRLLYFGEEYRNPHFGHLSLLGLTQWIVPETCGTWYVACCKYLNQEIAQMAHAQGNVLVIATHPKVAASYDDLSQWPGGGLDRALPLDLASGHLDAYDLLGYSQVPPDSVAVEYVQALNAGVRLPASAGSDANPASGSSLPPGGYRVFVRPGVPGDLTLDGWLNGMRAGRTFVSNYPIILTFQLGGALVGSTYYHDGSQATGSVEVACALPMEKVEILGDGRVIAVLAPAPGGDGTRIEGPFQVDPTGLTWVAARAVGPAGSWHLVGAPGLFAMTSPIYVEPNVQFPVARAGGPTRAGLPGKGPGGPATVVAGPERRAAADHFLASLDALRNLYDTQGFFPDPDSRSRFDSSLTQAVLFFESLAEDPPAPFTLLEPNAWSTAHGRVVAASTTPTLRWEVAVDLDAGSQVTYDLHYGTSPGLAGATVVTGLTQPSYTIPAATPISNLSVYYWRVVARDNTGFETWGAPNPWDFIVDVTATPVSSPVNPNRWVLEPAAPNPFNPRVRIEYVVPDPGGRHALCVYDVRGSLVRVLFEGERPTGRYREVWDGTDGRGHRAGSGVYFIRLRPAGGTGTLTHKVVLLE